MSPTVELAHRELGTGDGRPPVVILHGLLGSSRNWTGTARVLARRYRVLTPDLRNHGDSPHAEEHTTRAMAADVEIWLERLDIDTVFLVGHSMGGKAAMRLAADRPELVARLVVVDIAPRAYEGASAEIEALRALPLAEVASREEAEQRLEESIADAATRRFLLTNLRRDADGAFRWRVPLEALHRELPRMRAAPLEHGEEYHGATLFVRGGRSDYVRDEDLAAIRSHFPAARVETLEGSGHNPHVEARDALVELLEEFFEGEGKP